ncbi:GT1 domain-containing protein isoform X2 [Hoplias malabaricus]|uniref:GT1 domain-containing protein isoform X2 n=1 Tax=Hoplias malabaricus TaxID=27720 RepID=UPI00346291A7
MARERAAFFSQFEQEIILKTFEEYKAIITAKCNTAAAARSRVEAWKKIAERLNASNPNNVKRTWQQVKVKYKNIVQSNRKRAQKQMLGGISASGFTHAEELALWQIRGRPMMDAIGWAGSSDHTGACVRSPSSTEAESSGPVIQPVPTIIDSAEEAIDHSDSEHDDKNIVVCSHSDEGNETFIDHEEPGPSGPFRYTDEESDEDVTSLYKRYLKQEIAYRQLKMKKLEKEIQLLDKQLDSPLLERTE